MNKARRKRINDIRARLKDIKDEVSAVLKEEEEAWDKLPKAFQEGCQGDDIAEACDKLEWAENDIDNVMEWLEIAQA